MSNRGIYGNIVETRRNDGEFYLEWQIYDFFSLTNERGDRYKSPIFLCCNAKWGLAIHPNGTLQSSSLGWVSLFIFRVDKGPPKTFNVILGIQGADGVENKKEKGQEFSENDMACFWYGFTTLSELREHQSRLVPDGTLKITCNIKDVVFPAARDATSQTDGIFSEADVLIEENKSLGNPGVEELQNSLKSMLESGEDCDVTIKVQGKEFRAHRSILRARSPVFQAMFAHDMVEKQSGMVTMEDCDQGTFSHFLEHVYTGSVEMISIGNVCSLYRASEKYDLKTLKKACAEFLKENLTVASFCDAITLAVEYDDKELIERATEFFCNNALHIVKTAEWQIFMVENPTVANELYIKQLTK